MTTTSTRAGHCARFAGLALLVVGTLGCASHTRVAPAAGIDPALSDMSWLVGLWEAGDAAPGEQRPIQVEHWQVHDDGSLVAANYQRFGDEIVPHQNLAVRKHDDGRIVLEIAAYELVGNRAVPMPKPTYTLTDHGHDFARFEGPATVLPRAILYQRGPQGQMVISIVMPSADGEREFFVGFTRVKDV